MALSDATVFAGDLYSGSIDNVRRVVDLLTIGEDGNRSSFNEGTCRIYQKEANRIIDNKLSPYYAVPLQKGIGDDGVYPDPIPSIAVRLTASMIVLSEMTEIDANASESAQNFKDAALDELDRLTMGFFAGTQRLRCQRTRSRGRFYDQNIAPQMPSPDLR